MNRVVALLFLVCATFAIAPRTASAAPVTVPPGLNPGDQYRLAFVTSTQTGAFSNNIAGYNAFVTTAANSVPELAALGTSWKVIGSTYVAAQDNTATNPGISTGVPIFRLDAVKIASNNQDLWDGSLLAPISTNETGVNSADHRAVWTGTNYGGTPSYAPLGFFDPNFTFNEITIGSTDQIDTQWIDQARYPREFYFLPLYAMSGVLTVPVPEPSTMVLAGLAAAGLAVSSLRRRRQCRSQGHIVRDHR